MSAKKPPHKVGAFIKNYSFAELERNAEQAKRSGIAFWPEIVQLLLKKYDKLYTETAGLRQHELFAPASFTPPPRPRNGE